MLRITIAALALSAVALPAAAEAQDRERDRDRYDYRDHADRYDNDRHWYDADDRRWSDGDRDRRGGRNAYGIPPGHLPPPGSCRVWYGDRPPGHQPPPTSCRSAERQAYRYGGRVIYGGR